MAEDKDYVGRVRRLQRAGLLRLWADVRAGQTRGRPAGRAFEHLVLRAFELEGASVTWPFTVELQGHEVEQLDRAVHLPDLHCLVGAKDEAGAAGIAPLEPVFEHG